MCTASTHPLTVCALCLNPTAPEALDFIGVLTGPDVPVCVGCRGELLEVAEERNDRAFRSQVVRGLAQEFGVEDVMSVLADHVLDDAQNDVIEGDELPWDQSIDLMVAGL